MKVLLLSTYREPCGVATYCEALVSGLAEAGAETEVLAPFVESAEASLGPPLRLWSRSSATLGEAGRTVTRIRAARPDVVHIQHNLGLFSVRFLAAVALACAVLGIPVVATLHGRFDTRPARRRRLLAHILALSSARLVLHNEEHRRELRWRGRVDVIPHGLHAPPDRSIEAAKRALGVAEDERLVASLGFLHPHKGVLETIEAVAALRQQGRRLRYWVCGGCAEDAVSQNYLEALRARIRADGLEESVVLEARFLEDGDLMARLHAADLIVLNYRAGAGQGTSGAARTALSSGRPVAVSSAPIFDDLRDVTETLGGPLAVAIARLLDDPDVTERSRARTRRIADEQGWTAVAKRHLELYVRSLSRSARQTRLP